MKCVHTFGTGRHKRKADITLLFQYISQLIRFARVCSNVDDFNNRKLFLTAKLLKQAIDILKFEILPQTQS